MSTLPLSLSKGQEEGAMPSLSDSGVSPSHPSHRSACGTLPYASNDLKSQDNLLHALLVTELQDLKGQVLGLQQRGQETSPVKHRCIISDSSSSSKAEISTLFPDISGATYKGSATGLSNWFGNE